MANEEKSFQKTNINWFPGHMAQTRRLIRENLGSVDIVLELVDARIPRASRNPEIREITRGKKSLVILNKADLASPGVTARWMEFFRHDGCGAVALDCKTGKGLQEVLTECRSLLAEKIKRDREKGMTKPIRAMIVGVPNVGKSTLINRFAGKKKVQAENRPGVTRQKQWIRASSDLELLDTPGVLWPKFEGNAIGENLAITGAIKDSILESVEIACILCQQLQRIAPELLAARYRLTPEETAQEPYDLFCTIGKKRGFLVSGGEVNEDRCAAMLLEEFRSGTIGRISLEAPEENG